MIVKPIEYIETPALLIDMDAVERNIQTMNSFLEGKTIRLRPHFKTAKIPEISRMQLDASAKGITCAKLSEAEALADAGIEDILIANQVADHVKIERLAVLAGRVRHIAVAVDTVCNVQKLNDACVCADTTLGVLVELDVGMGRCGVRNYDEGLAVVRAVAEAPNLIFEGIQAYEGHLVLIPETKERENGVAGLLPLVRGFKEYLEKQGFPVSEVSGGGTGTYALTGAGDVYTELQAGSYIYMDTRYGNLGLPFEYALYILGMVIAKHDGLAILDVGLKGMSTENGAPRAIGFEKSALKLSEEHCSLEDPENKLNVCDTVMFVPSHCCTNINLYDIAYGMRNGMVERVFDVKGRGKSQ